MTSALAPAAPPAAPSPPADPCDMGALLRGAVEGADVTQADLARMTGMTSGNVSRALKDPNARPVVVRRILAALGMRLAVVPVRKL